MIEVKPVREKDVDTLALRVFLKSIEILGGPRKLVEHRNLTWLPSLMAASYAIVLKEEFMKSAESIAKELGITKQTATNILRADEKEVLKKINLDEQEESKRIHVAGGLAKLAYKEIKEGRDESSIHLEISKSIAKSLGADWAVHVLSSIKGMDFPADKETLVSRLAGYEIEGKRLEEILEKLSYPIRNPAELLREIGRISKGED